MRDSLRPFVTGLRCFVCDKITPYGNVHTCPACGEQGILDVRYDYDTLGNSLRPEVLLARPHNHWRYRELLPIVQEASLPPLQIGWTPIYDVPRLASEIGIKRLFLKDDGRNPTSSFKD